ncbi:MAG: hypothetical protein H6981_00460 [Gammaproteobacteria bacterium]|nr:hypothetical protein [Gammaproteobacteria bacterium]MCP5135260.1 hypothetical protein [Gammaproteobacteria bacterium]
MALLIFIGVWIFVGLGEATFGEAFVVTLILTGLFTGLGTLLRHPGRSLLLILLLVLNCGGSS